MTITVNLIQNLDDANASTFNAPLSEIVAILEVILNGSTALTQPTTMCIAPVIPVLSVNYALNVMERFTGLPTLSPAAYG